jgi:adenylate cyclase
VVVPSVERHGGRVFKTTGDGFLAIFASAGEALDAAIEIQDGFAARDLRLRIGLNLGDVIEADGDVFGDGVNIAARLEAMAEPGGIYASAAVARGISRRPDLRFARLGQRRGKNLPDPIEVYAVRRGEARRRFRPPALAAASVAAILAAGAVLWATATP